MMTRQELANKYDALYTALQDEFFETIHIGTPQRERVLRDGKLATDLNAQQEVITQAYEAELLAEGYESLNPPEQLPRSTHISVLESVDTLKTRPANVKRVWEGNDYYFDCFVTQTVKDQYVAGDIVIGDYVLVHFDDVGEQVVTDKVFKSWV